MKIKKVILHNFRAYKDVEIDFDDFNCIIGKNDVGKSTIFVALDWFFGNRELTDDDFNVENLKFERDGSNKAGGALSVEVYFENVTRKRHVLLCSPHVLILYLNDFMDENNCIRIKKVFHHTQSISKNLAKNAYSIQTYCFSKLNKCLSAFKDKEIDELCTKIGIDVKKIEQDSLFFETKINQKFLARDKKCDCIYEFYNRCDQRILSKSQLVIDLDKYISFPVFKYDRLNTSVYDYIRLFLNLKKTEIEDKVNDIKKTVADSLSNELFSNEIVKEQFDFTDSIEIMAESVLKTKEGIPLQNRGDGFQKKVKTAIFKMLCEQECLEPRSIIFAFEEPEVNLHPEEQRKMFKALKELSKNVSYQVFITTHSPFIVKELAQNGDKWIVLEQKDGCTSKINSENMVLKYDGNHVSMNEINYLAFDEASIDYHIELFGYIHNKLKDRYKYNPSFTKNWDATYKYRDKNGKEQVRNVNSITSVEEWFVKECGLKKMTWYDTNNYAKEDRTLPYCVRNNIDHPLCGCANGDAEKNNSRYNDINLIKESIDIMRKIISDKGLNK